MAGPFDRIVGIDTDAQLPNEVRARLAANLGDASTPEGLQLTTSIEEQVATATPSYADRGEQFMGELRYGKTDMNLGLAGDSTGNSATEWADLLMTALGVDHPDVRVLIPHWSDATASPWSDTSSGAYGAPVEVQPGEPGEVGLVFQDTFSRTASDLYGTTPDLGSAWGRDGSNAVGDWTLDGSKAVRTTNMPSGAMLADTQQQGPQRVSLSGTLSTVADGASRQARFYSNYSGPTDHAYAQLAISESGVSVLSLVARTTATGARTVGSGASGLAVNTAGVPITWSIELVGTTLSMTLNGVTQSGEVTETEAAVLRAGTKAGFNGWTPGGATIDSFDIEITEGHAPRELTLYNASMPGSRLDYHLPRVARMFPEPLSLVVINSIHNYGDDTPEEHWAKIDQFIAALRVVQPTAGIIVTSQNPRKPPAASDAHDARSAAARSYAARRGYGYIPAFEAFVALPDKGYSLIKSDGVHPTEGATDSGSSLWRDAAESYLASI